VAPPSQVAQTHQGVHFVPLQRLILVTLAQEGELLQEPEASLHHGERGGSSTASPRAGDVPASVARALARPWLAVRTPGYQVAAYLPAR
jgi:hypothetical protein